jgi:putative N6-adenine-specific DNA methylase
MAEKKKKNTVNPLRKTGMTNTAGRRKTHNTGNPGCLYTYQDTGSYFAQIAEGLEPLAQDELTRLGAAKIKPGFRGLYFQADHRALYRINYSSRFIQKIIAPLMFLDCHSTKYLHKRAKAIDWTHFLSPDQTFAIVANVSNSHIRHSKYAALCLKDAIVDFFNEKYDRRPNVDTDHPDVWLNLYIHNNRAVIGLEVSGGSLHKRGYRSMALEAPMQETIAAAIIGLAQWDGERPLHDPMCGSGTLLCEALMCYCRIPAGYFRKRFGFEHLPDFDRRIWKAVQQETEQAIRPLPESLITGSDISVKALEATRANLAVLPGGRDIKLKAIDFRNIKCLENSTIVCNPPYGLRLQKREGIETFYRDLGDFLKQRCRGSAAYVYFGDRQLIKCIGLRSSWKKPLASGGLDGRLVKLEIF